MKHLILIVLLGAIQSCSPVKNYQKMYLNDDCMSLGIDDIESGEVAFQSYREGAAGANGGKVGGGCGCN